MGSPPQAVRLPIDAPVLAVAVRAIHAVHDCDPDELTGLLRSARSGGADSPQLTAAAWVLDPTSSEVLLVHHPVLGWACPGGHVEQGESPAAAAARELTEETGLHLTPTSDEPITLSTADMPADHRGPAHRHWVLGYRFSTTSATELHPEDGRPARWFPIDRLPQHAPADLAPLVRWLTAE